MDAWVGFDIAKEAVEDRMKIRLEAKHANTSVGRIQLRALHNIWDDMSPEEVKEDLLIHKTYVVVR